MSETLLNNKNHDKEINDDKEDEQNIVIKTEPVENFEIYKNISRKTKPKENFNSYVNTSKQGNKKMQKKSDSNVIPILTNGNSLRNKVLKLVLWFYYLIYH